MCAHSPDRMFPSCCDEKAILCPDNIDILPRFAAQFYLSPNKKQNPVNVFLITEFNINSCTEIYFIYKIMISPTSQISSTIYYCNPGA